LIRQYPAAPQCGRCGSPASTAGVPGGAGLAGAYPRLYRRLALYAQIEPTADLIALNHALQKIYTSIEMQPDEPERPSLLGQVTKLLGFTQQKNRTDMSDIHLAVETIDWPDYPEHDPRVSGIPDNTPFSRNEGPEVIHLIEEICALLHIMTKTVRGVLKYRSTMSYPVMCDPK
jgi:hypothetical protein